MRTSPSRGTPSPHRPSTSRECAPSRSDPFQFPAAEQLLAAGVLVVAPDYEGLGVEDETHPYLVGAASGADLLDAARVGAAEGGGHEVVIFGHSQGGHAALFARQLAGELEGELDVLGVVAAAPVTDPSRFLLQGRTDPRLFPFTAEALLAWSEVYEEPELSDLVVVEDAEAVRLARDEACTEDLVAPRPLDEIFVDEPENIDAWTAVAAANTPVAGDLGIPVLLTHGDADALGPVEGTLAFHDELCAAGERVVLLRDASWGHGLALSEPLDEILGWIADRFAGVEAPTDCG